MIGLSSLRRKVAGAKSRRRRSVMGKGNACFPNEEKNKVISFISCSFPAGGTLSLSLSLSLSLTHCCSTSENLIIIILKISHVHTHAHTRIKKSVSNLITSIIISSSSSTFRICSCLSTPFVHLDMLQLLSELLILVSDCA